MGSYSERFCSVLPAIKIESQFVFFLLGKLIFMKNTVNLFHLATHLFILTTYPQKPFKKRLFC